MTSLRLTSAPHSRRDPRSFGQLVRARVESAPLVAPAPAHGLIADLKLFAGTFAAGFVFVSVYLA